MAPVPQVDEKTAAESTAALRELLKDRLVNSWVAQLSEETADNLARSRRREGLSETDANQTKRPVYNGHYVLVKPTPLPKPRLVLYSKDVANLLELDVETVESPAFLSWVSGDASVLPEGAATWATPYALSIMGTRYTNNCPYGTGDGYGDGRAISIGELSVGQEMQLKGAGRTPFARGADGRAVLRSSIREFLASEAMHFLGISTTRALSLVVSEQELIGRPWYTDDATLTIPDMDDPRLAKYPEDQRRQVIQQLRQQKADPNIMIQEKAAITCRVARSFCRIGHVDVFYRRVERKRQQAARESASGDASYDTSSREWKELEDMIWHACYREAKEEAYDPYYEKGDIASAATVLLKQSARGIADMVAGWIRVGFAQGNFNADNCLIAGRTMDYGPFGWLEEYNPVFAKWTGSGQHFGFLNQPQAGFVNYQILVDSVVPVICAQTGQDRETVMNSFLEPTAELFQRAVDQAFRQKLGFAPDQDVGDDVWQELEPLIRKSRTDWTLLFRELTYLTRDFADSDDFAAMMTQLERDDTVRAGSSPFYEPLTDELRQEWIAWLKTWRSALTDDSQKVFERMRTTNPKYILREWMLVDAYTAAANNEEAELFRLHTLIQAPYDEGSERETNRYYRRASDQALTAGGTAFMS